MFWAAFTSLSAAYPHDPHTWVLTESDFRTTSPHSKHRCDVKRGDTLTTRAPAFSALSVRISMKADQLASEMARARWPFLSIFWTRRSSTAMKA